MTGGAALAAAVAGGWALERGVARTFDRPDPAADDVLDLPADVEHHHLPLSDGGTTYVAAAGAGRPVVLLHGITMRAEAWAHQFSLRDRARVLAVDLRGHGRSAPGTDAPTLDRCAADLAELLEAFDLRHAVLVGHSLGGMVLGRFLLDHPDVAAQRAGAYALLGTAGRMPVASPAPVLAALGDRLVADAAAGGRLSAGLGRIPPSDLGEWALRRAFGRRPSRRHLDLVAASYAQLPPAVFTSLLRSLVGFDALPAWSSVDRPVAIAVGTRDRIVPPRESERLARVTPGSRLVRYRHAGHLLVLERRHAVTALLADLLGR